MPNPTLTLASKLLVLATWFVAAAGFLYPETSQFGRVVPCVEPGGAHLVAADAGELRVGKALAQCIDQAGAEQVAGGFSGAQRDAQRASRGGGNVVQDRR